MIIQGDKVVFKVATNNINGTKRATCVTPIRRKKRAKIESTKGDYGFIAYKVEGRTDSQSFRSRGESVAGPLGAMLANAQGSPNAANGANNIINGIAEATPAAAGNLFFHSKELVDVDMSDINIGDVVEFDVVHIKRTNKYCAAKVKVVEKNETILPENIARMNSKFGNKSRNTQSVSTFHNVHYEKDNVDISFMGQQEMGEMHENQFGIGEGGF